MPGQIRKYKKIFILLNKKLCIEYKEIIFRRVLKIKVQKSNNRFVSTFETKISL